MLRDIEMRSVLLHDLQRVYAGDPDTHVIEELGLCRGQARVDVAVVNGLIHGYEIKSDQDSLRRLDSQVRFYGKVVDRATLVVGSHHATTAPKLVPEWWGVQHVRHSINGFRIKSVRRARRNPGKDPRSLAELLWLDDALALLEDCGAIRGLRGKPRKVVWDRLCECLTANEIDAAVRAKLKDRAERLSPRQQQ